jgi:hypothetical protein
VCPSVLKAAHQEEDDEPSTPLRSKSVASLVSAARPEDDASPHAIAAPRLADVCPLNHPWVEEESSKACSKPPSERAATPDYNESLPESIRHSPHHHLLHPPIEPARLIKPADCARESSRHSPPRHVAPSPHESPQPVKNADSGEDVKEPIRESSSHYPDEPFQHADELLDEPIRRGSHQPCLDHHATDSLTEPAQSVQQEDELSHKPLPEYTQIACMHSNRGLAQQRSLLCTALAATKLRNTAHGAHTDHGIDPLAPGGFPSIASMLLRTTPSMNNKRPVTARTSIQSTFEIGAVHDEVEDDGQEEDIDDSAPLDRRSGDLSVCCTPRISTQLRDLMSPRPLTSRTAATTQLLGVEKFRGMGAGGSNGQGVGSSGGSQGGSTSAVSSFGRPENADSAELVGKPGSIWDNAGKIGPSPRTRTMLRKGAGSGFADVLRKNTSGVLHMTCISRISTHFLIAIEMPALVNRL